MNLPNNLVFHGANITPTQFVFAINEIKTRDRVANVLVKDIQDGTVLEYLAACPFVFINSKCDKISSFTKRYLNRYLKSQQYTFTIFTKESD